MGGSVALATRNAINNCLITGYDISGVVGRWALRRRIIDRVADDPAAAVRDADLVVLATPLSDAIELVRQISGHLPAHALVTDVCSTKASISQAARQNLTRPGRFVGSHPMAGSQYKGLKHADGTIFRQSLCILTPLPGTPSSTTAGIAGFWRRLGMTTLAVPPSRHDRLVALASHLPQVAASALMAAQSEESLRVAGPGLRDTTRLAASPGELWAGILLDNQRPVRSAIRALRARLDAIDRAVARGDRRAIERLFATASANRSRLEHARGGKP